MLLGTLICVLLADFQRSSKSPARSCFSRISSRWRASMSFLLRSREARREVACGNAALNHLSDALQPLRREPDFFRLANRGDRADRQGEKREQRETDNGRLHHDLPGKVREDYRPVLHMSHVTPLDYEPRRRGNAEILAKSLRVSASPRFVSE